jgi:pentatricopeptide repeat protein
MFRLYRGYASIIRTQLPLRGLRLYTSEASEKWHRLIRDAQSPDQLRAILRRLVYKHPKPQQNTLMLVLDQCATLGQHTSSSTRAQLLRTIKEVEKYIHNKDGSMPVYRSLLNAYANCGHVTDVDKVMQSMQKQSIWPDLVCYEAWMKVNAREGRLFDTLRLAEKASQTLSRRLHVERWLRGALWTAGGVVVAKWAGMGLAGVLGAGCEPVVWLGVGVVTLMLAARTMAGFWIWSADTTRNETSRHPGDAMLLLSSRDINQHLQSVTVRCMLEHWDETMAQHVRNELETEVSLERWLKGGGVWSDVPPAWLQTLYDGLTNVDPIMAWQVADIIQQRTHIQTLPPTLMSPLMEAFRRRHQRTHALAVATLAKQAKLSIPAHLERWLETHHTQHQ